MIDERLIRRTHGRRPTLDVCTGAIDTRRPIMSDSQFPAIPVLRTGPLAGGSRPQPPLGDVAMPTQPVSASCGDSQFPAIPVLRTGPLAGGSRRHFITASAAAFV